MPWRIEGTMDLKVQMIADWLRDNLNVTDLSWKYDISRPTVYKWIERYKEEGIEGLKEQKRTPACSTLEWLDDSVNQSITIQILERAATVPGRRLQISLNGATLNRCTV